MAANGHILFTDFYESGTVAQWQYVLSHYGTVLQLIADNKKKGGKDLIKLDSWYQEQLPDLIKKRPKKHLTYDEIVKVMKWKLLRGKFRPRLTDLVKTNTPLAIVQATTRGFKRMPNLSQAITALATLKGVGPAMASAVLAAGVPDSAAFMSDEAMLSIPDITSIDYTTKEYLNYSEHIQKCVDRLNGLDKNSAWTPHKVEQTLWTHFLAKKHDPSLLDNMPASNEQPSENETAVSDAGVTNGNSNIENPPLTSSEAQDNKESSAVDDADDSNSKDSNDTESKDSNDISSKDIQDEENCDPAKEEDETKEIGENEKTDVDGPPPKKLKAQ